MFYSIKSEAGIEELWFQQIGVIFMVVTCLKVLGSNGWILLSDEKTVYFKLKMVLKNKQKQRYVIFVKFFLRFVFYSIKIETGIEELWFQQIGLILIVVVCLKVLGRNASGSLIRALFHNLVFLGTKMCSVTLHAYVWYQNVSPHPGEVFENTFRCSKPS